MRAVRAGSGGAPGVLAALAVLCLRRSTSTYRPGRSVQPAQPSAYPPARLPDYWAILSAHLSVYVCVCCACCFG